MTGMAQERPDEEQVRREQEPVAEPPLPGPVDDTAGPVTIIPGPAAEDSPVWQPDRQPPHTSPAPATAGRHLPHPTGQGGSGRTITGVMSDVTRNGRWEVPATLTLVQAMSDITLDLREAVITSPEIEIRFYGLMADLKVIVPPGVEVQWGDGLAVMSGEKADRPGQVDPSLWRLRVTQFSMMSDVKVKTLAAGESPTKKWWKSWG